MSHWYFPAQITHMQRPVQCTGLHWSKRSVITSELFYWGGYWWMFGAEKTSPVPTLAIVPCLQVETFPDGGKPSIALHGPTVSQQGSVSLT